MRFLAQTALQNSDGTLQRGLNRCVFFNLRFSTNVSAYNVKDRPVVTVDQ